jgi:hypothetical protein
MAKKKKVIVSKEVSDLIATASKEALEILGEEVDEVEIVKVTQEPKIEKEPFFLGLCPVTGKKLFTN